MASGRRSPQRFPAEPHTESRATGLRSAITASKIPEEEKTEGLSKLASFLGSHRRPPPQLGLASRASFILSGGRLGDHGETIQSSGVHQRLKRIVAVPLHFLRKKSRAITVRKGDGQRGSGSGNKVILMRDGGIRDVDCQSQIGESILNKHLAKDFVGFLVGKWSNPYKNRKLFRKKINRATEAWSAGERIPSIRVWLGP